MMLVFNYTLSVCITSAIGISRVFQSPRSLAPYRKATAFPEYQQFPPVFTSPRRGFRDIFSSLFGFSFSLIIFFIVFFSSSFDSFLEFRSAGLNPRGNGIATAHYPRDSTSRYSEHNLHIRRYGLENIAPLFLDARQSHARFCRLRSCAPIPPALLHSYLQRAFY